MKITCTMGTMIFSEHILNRFYPFKINGEVQHGWAGQDCGIPIIHEKLSKGPNTRDFMCLMQQIKINAMI